MRDFFRLYIASVDDKQSEFDTQKLAVGIRPSPKLFHVTLKFNPLESWKSKSFDHLTKTTLAPGAYSQFQNYRDLFYISAMLFKSRNG
jgi:hypothetical protein